MIKCKVDKCVEMLQVAGSNETIAAEIGLLVGQVYKALRNQNEMAAKQFQKMILITMMPIAPTWELEAKDGEVTICQVTVKEREEDDD